MHILFIGDVVGRPGRQAVKKLLPPLIKDKALDFVIANGENTAGGKGLTPGTADELFHAGVDVITGGNHIWANRELMDIIAREERIIRPANYPVPDEIPGRGSGVFPTKNHEFRVAVFNMLGRIYMNQMDCPFRHADRLVEDLRRLTPLIVLDFHAEATSEKIAMGWHMDGRITALIGTHTHIQTADNTVLPGGMAYITDVGMTGPYDSVIGVRKEIILKTMKTQMPARYEIAEGDARLAAVLIEADPQLGRALSIERMMLPLK